MPEKTLRRLKQTASASILVVATALASAPVGATETVTYAYDALGRLTGRGSVGTVNNGLNVATAFDAAGNRLAYNVTGASGAPSPSFSIGNASAVTEGGTLTYTVTKTGAASTNYSVDYATTGGSATSGSDYTPKSGTLTFLPADTSKPITVATNDDGGAEYPETVLVSLSNPSGGSTISTSQGSGTINDNDTTPVSFAIGNAAAVSEGGTFTFYVSKSGSTASNYTVNYATANGSADGSDYTAKSGTLTFAPGDVSLPIPVQTTDDNVYEGDETVLVNLSNASGGATITTAQASGTIPGNDLHPPVTVNDTKSMGKCAIATINLTANDSDPDGFLPLKITSLAGGPAIHATIVSDSSIEFDAQVPAGQYAITYTVQDTRGAIAQATGTVTITVTGTQICN